MSDVPPERIGKVNTPWLPGTITVMSCRHNSDPHWHATRQTRIYDRDWVHDGPRYEICPHEGKPMAQVPLTSGTRSKTGAGRTGESMSDWRTGRKVLLNVYYGVRPICQCHTAEEARMIVDGMNALAASQAEIERLRQALEQIESCKVTGPSPIGPLHGAGMAAAFECTGKIAREALGPPVTVSAVPPTVKDSLTVQPDSVVNDCLTTQSVDSAQSFSRPKADDWGLGISLRAAPGSAVKITNSALIPAEFWRWDGKPYVGAPGRVPDLAYIGELYR